MAEFGRGGAWGVYAASPAPVHSFIGAGGLRSCPLCNYWWSLWQSCFDGTRHSPPLPLPPGWVRAPPSRHIADDLWRYTENLGGKNRRPTGRRKFLELKYVYIAKSNKKTAPKKKKITYNNRDTRKFSPSEVKAGMEAVRMKNERDVQQRYQHRW